MTLTLDDNTARYQIRGFKPGLIQVNQASYSNSIILNATTLIEHWEPQYITDLAHSHLNQAALLKPDVLILGTGEVLQFPDIALYAHLIELGIGVEIMDTHAACRTYNILTSENRNVVAALIIR